MSIYVCIFENGWENSKILLELLRHFSVTLYITKQLTASYLFQQSLFSQRMCVGEWFSQMFFNTRCRPIETPPFTFPHFNYIISFFFDVLLPHLVHSSLFVTAFDIVFSWGRLCFLTWTVMIEATHSLKHSITMRVKTICLETINLFPSSCEVETLNFTVRSLSLEKWHNHDLKDLFCWGLKLLDSVSYSHRVYNTVGMGWHIEYG